MVSCPGFARDVRSPESAAFLVIMEAQALRGPFAYTRACNFEVALYAPTKRGRGIMKLMASRLAPDRPDSLLGLIKKTTSESEKCQWRYEDAQG